MRWCALQRLQHCSVSDPITRYKGMQWWHTLVIWWTLAAVYRIQNCFKWFILFVWMQLVVWIAIASLFMELCSCKNSHLNLFYEFQKSFSSFLNKWTLFLSSESRFDISGQKGQSHCAVKWKLEFYQFLFPLTRQNWQPLTSNCFCNVAIAKCERLVTASSICPEFAAFSKN